MTVSDVRKRLAAGEDPLDLAIEKWVEIREGRGEDLGDGNCALCIAYVCCSACPIHSQGTSQVGGCDGTPYAAWEYHREKAHGSTFGPCKCPKCEKIADKEIAFLKSFKK